MIAMSGERLGRRARSPAAASDQPELQLVAARRVNAAREIETGREAGADGRGGGLLEKGPARAKAIMTGGVGSIFHR